MALRAEDVAASREAAVAAGHFLRRQIRAQLAFHGMTQRDLGDAIGIHQTSVSQALLGKRNFTIEEVVAIAKVFGMSLVDLVIDPREVHAQSSPWITARTLGAIVAALGTSWGLLPPELDGDVVRLWPRSVPDLEEAAVEVPAPAEHDDELEVAA